jgi:hypothetical protein
MKTTVNGATQPVVAVAPAAGAIIRGGFVLGKTIWNFKEQFTKKQDELRQKSLGQDLGDAPTTIQRVDSGTNQAIGFDVPPMWFRDP